MDSSWSHQLWVFHNKIWCLVVWDFVDRDYQLWTHTIPRLEDLQKPPWFPSFFQNKLPKCSWFVCSVTQSLTLFGLFFQAWPTRRWSVPWRKAIECSAWSRVPLNSMKSCWSAGRTSPRIGPLSITCRVSWRISTRPRRASTSSSLEAIIYSTVTLKTYHNVKFRSQIQPIQNDHHS